MSIGALATSPFALMAAELCHIAIMTGFTSADSFWRVATLPFQFWIIWIAIRGGSMGTYGSMIQPIVTGYAVTYVLDYVDRVLLQRWSFEAGGPTRMFSPGRATPAVTNAQTVWARLAFGFDAATSRRHVNTPYEVKNCPHFSEVPSRSRFLLETTRSVILCYLFIDLNDLNAQSDQDISLFSPDKVGFFSRLGRVTPEEVVVKFVVAAILWATSYCMIRMTYDMVAIVAVATGITDARAWRPLFGSFWDIYSVRAFWGTFWHQQLRDSLNDPATIITRRIPSRVVRRYTKILICFFISGVVHMLGDLANDLTYAQSGAIRFFTTQALGIMIEDGVQEMWGRSQGRWKRVVGFLWVWAFLAWTSPCWMFAPIVARASGESGPLMGRLSLARYYASR